MQKQYVSSSNLSSVGYNALQMVLEIQFKDGALYQYFDVPQGVYFGLVSAPSHGKYFHTNIEHNYRYARVG